ncbi:MAG: type III-B CRISPR-associated protein Cas10/Cmr2 [Dethiobacteria bacterium]
MNILNFSIGPVQGFIARARKTRDFWAGSFLLSYLAGQAMAVILENEGQFNSTRSCKKQG